MESKTARKGQRGYILAMVLGAMTVMGILMTKAMPSVITEIQRENEEELVFRGEAIARAIKAYRKSTGSYPTSLEAMLKVKPRIIRKLYKDPMTNGDWDVVTAVQAGASGDKTSLPIAAVRSRCTKDSFRSYNGKTMYSDWIFSGADDLYGIPGVSSELLKTLSTIQTK
ncbi:type II secretion system protein [Holophaga foetida]|uniref:type II secretion system protein n=1 Tax=Holophaga foetida TaxID=35839 RepID=UPI00024732F8|nr:type II secretion system protein [Holophaga foetida]